MESIDIVRKQVAESERVKAELSKNEEVIAAIAKAADVCTEAYRRGNKTMFAGNGPERLARQCEASADCA